MPNLPIIEDYWGLGDTSRTSRGHDFRPYLSKKVLPVPKSPVVFSLLSKPAPTTSFGKQSWWWGRDPLEPPRFSGDMGTRPLISDRYAEKPCPHAVPMSPLNRRKSRDIASI